MRETTFVKMNFENTTTLNPLESMTEKKVKDFFESSLQNLYEVIEVIQSEKLTQQERDALYRVFVKNNNIMRDTNLVDVYKELLKKESKGNKGLSRLINTLKNLI